ncbi:MAG TPA: CBS domain-containing protein [Rhizobium sp.]|nr:CBS domain-containing protein [Rhizobium sp.]
MEYAHHVEETTSRDLSSALPGDGRYDDRAGSSKGLGIQRVEQLLHGARERLVAIAAFEPLTKVAELLFEPTRRMVVVHNSEGSMIGVVTRTDIVRQIRHCHGCSCATACSDVMTGAVISCRVEDRLDDVWRIMTDRGLHNIPVVDRQRRPIGVLSARDVLEARLASVEYEEDLLKDYVMCVGYR